MERYSPKGNSKNKKSKGSVLFHEAKPPKHLASIVHRYIQIWTDKPLDFDYHLHALPDACTYLIFDQLRPNVAGPAVLHSSAVEFNLGKQFHYVNIRLYPGTWQTCRIQPFVGQIDQAYTGELPLLAVNQALSGLAFKQQQEVLTQLVEELVNQQILVTNVIVARILRKIDTINSVEEMAKATRFSPRHLQRRLKQETGFTPHDFLKVIRLQRSLSDHYLEQYSDQAHFIRSFRSATGWTPSKYYKNFDV